METIHFKYFLALPLIVSLLLACPKIESQNDQAELKSTILQVVKAFKEKDAATLNQLIDKDKDLHVIFRPGVFDIYRKTDKIDFDKPVPTYFPYRDFLTDYNLKFESLPTYDCENYEWSKTGLYCDTTKRDFLLSKTAENMKRFDLLDVPESEIELFKEIEKNSRRVVLTDDQEGELIFYLTLINNKWYLTILDRVTSDCSA